MLTKTLPQVYHSTESFQPDIGVASMRNVEPSRDDFFARLNREAERMLERKQELAKRMKAEMQDEYRFRPVLLTGGYENRIQRADVDIVERLWSEGIRVQQMLEERKRNFEKVRSHTFRERKHVSSTTDRTHGLQELQPRHRIVQRRSLHIVDGMRQKALVEVYQVLLWSAEYKKVRLSLRFVPLSK
jgi:hypothetical protein